MFVIVSVQNSVHSTKSAANAESLGYLAAFFCVIIHLAVLVELRLVTDTDRHTDNKSSAVAEMNDRGHNRHGPKRGGLLCPFRGGAGSPSNTM